MFQSNKFSSFMISDILKCDKQDVGFHHIHPHMSMDYNLYNSYVNHTNDFKVSNKSHNYCTWNHSIDNNQGMDMSMGCVGPTADTIVWQHYLLRQRMLMQAKPRKGGQIRFTSEQSVSLEKEFRRQKYLSPVERKTMASELGLSERQIKTWFQNRRAKWRRCKQLSGDGDEDKHILLNKYKDTHSCSRDNDNDEPYESCHTYQCENNSHPNDIMVDFRLINIT